MTAHDRLRVHVNDELVLDAGTWEEVSGPDGPERLIQPPETTLFQQMLAYLRDTGRCILNLLADLAKAAAGAGGSIPNGT